MKYSYLCGIYQYITMTQDNLERLIEVLFSTIKPIDIETIDFSLRPTNFKNEYYMDITHVVPDNSIYLLVKNQIRTSHYMAEWKMEIKRMIKDYFDVIVIITSFGMTQHSFYNKQPKYKEYNNGKISSNNEIR
jgi:hypothetical protein